MGPLSIMVLVVIGIAAIVIAGIVALFMKLYVKVEQGTAMIVNTMRAEPEVTFTGRLVIPVIHKKEFMNIALKTIEIDRRSKDGLICKDNIRADINVAFYVRVNKTRDDVLKVAQAVGCARASDQQTLEELFSAKFSEALKTVGKQMDFEELYEQRDNFRDKIIAEIGTGLNGYVLEDAAIDYLEQTPLEHLDHSNILDSQGIRKITQLTAMQKVQTNELQRDEEMQIKKKDVEAREAILELERQQEDAEARQAREIATVRAREKAEQEKIESEELLKSESARILTAQNVAVQEENKQREVEVAQKARERAIAIETEQVHRVRQLEIIERERETELKRIAKEKAVEEQKKEIADVVRTRIAVDKTVAEEEERIKELREVSEADRARQSQVILAEGQAQEGLVKAQKAAEAQELAAKHEAAKQITLAQASFEASEKEAEAKKRLAEGIEAEVAAPGLAAARVDEAKAIALEKTGLAQAKVSREQALAEAQGLEEKGMAEVRVKEADSVGEERQAMVAVKVQAAEAEVVESLGAAEATAIRARFKAEAEGLTEKLAAMGNMTETSQAHEEFRMQLDKAHEQTMKAIDVNKDIAGLQAELLGKTLKEADIDIVGGDGEFLDKFFKAIAVGKSIDEIVGRSDTIQAMIGNGGVLADRLKDMLAERGSNKAVSNDDAK